MKYFVFDLGGVLSVPMVSKKLYEQIKWKVSYDEFLDKFNILLASPTPSHRRT